MTAATREKIVETAARLFHEQGFASTGVATILREAEVNSGSLYHFFSSKDELLKGVLDWYLDNLYPMIMAPVTGRKLIQYSVYSAFWGGTVTSCSSMNAGWAARLATWRLR